MPRYLNACDGNFLLKEDGEGGEGVECKCEILTINNE